MLDYRSVSNDTVMGIVVIYYRCSWSWFNEAADLKAPRRCVPLPKSRRFGDVWKLEISSNSHNTWGAVILLMDKKPGTTTWDGKQCVKPKILHHLKWCMILSINVNVNSGLITHLLQFHRGRFGWCTAGIEQQKLITCNYSVFIHFCWPSSQRT